MPWAIRFPVESWLPFIVPIKVVVPDVVPRFIFAALRLPLMLVLPAVCERFELKVKISVSASPKVTA